MLRSSLPTSAAWPLALLLLAACGDDGGSSSGGGPGAGGGDAQTGSGPGGPGSGAGGPGSGTGGGAGSGGDTSSGSTSSGPTTSSSTGAGGAPPCTAETLAESVRVTSVSLDVAAASGRAITAQVGSSSVVAWAGVDGRVHVTSLDAVDARAAADVSVEGTQVFGVAATESDVALLVARAPDFMTFVRLDRVGTELGRADLVGGGDHLVQDVEWFGEFAQTGRFVAVGDGTFAAYHALHRRWPDGIGHQGDTLRLLDGSGAPLGGWGWGCSHSMDQRLATGPNGLVPICISDCYPGKGIYFNHQAAMITADPAANCAGGFSTLLGGLVATATGFSLVYQDASGAAHLGTFDASGGVVADRSLTVPGSSRLAAYDGGLLLGSGGPGSAALQRLDASGNDVGEPAMPPGLSLPEQDFEGRSDGEVAWANASGSALEVVRVRVCE